MDVWQAVVLGVVEGITEYLPVSSTGHLIIASDLLGLTKTPADKHAADAFCIIIQGGAILAVLALYWPRFVQMMLGLLGRDAAGRRLLLNVLIAFVPAAVLGLALNKKIEEHLFHLWPVVGMLVAGGLFMIAFDAAVIRRRAAEAAGDGGRAVTDLTPRGALLIGLLQCVSLWPGTSRSMMTISGGMLAGLRPAAAAEFSFLLGMPTLLAATAYKLYKDIAQARATGAESMIEHFGWMPITAGIITAGVCAAVAVKFLVAFINRRGFLAMGVYRIALGAVLAALVIGGVVSVG